MNDSSEFLKKIVDLLSEHIVVIDEAGSIVYVNQSWVAFAARNGAGRAEQWEGVSYLAVCEASARNGD